MTTKYRRMSMDTQGAPTGAWVEFSDDEMAERYGAAKLPELFNLFLTDPQQYTEVWRNDGWRPASIRVLPLWQRASEMEIIRVTNEAARLRRQAGDAYREQGALLEATLLAVKEAEDRLREQRTRVTAAEEQMKSDIATVKKLESSAASKRKDLDKRLAMLDASTSPKTAEPVTA